MSKREIKTTAEQLSSHLGRMAAYLRKPCDPNGVAGKKKEKSAYTEGYKKGKKNQDNIDRQLYLGGHTPDS